MAITKNDLTSGSDATNQGSKATASISPTSNALILVAFEVGFVSSKTDPPLSPTVTGNGITYTLITKKGHWADTANWWNCLYLFRGLAASPSSGAITVDFGADTMDAIAYAVSEFVGVDTSGTNGSGAIVQSASNYADGSDTTTVTLSAFADATNNVAFSVSGAGDTGGTPRTFTADTGFSEIYDTGAEYAAVETAWKTGQDTSIITLASASSSGVAGIAVEIKMAAAAPNGLIMLLGDGGLM